MRNKKAESHTENKQQNDKSKPLLITNYFTCKLSNQKTGMGRMDFKTMIALYAVYKRICLEPKIQLG